MNPESTPSYNDIIYTVEESIAVITLNRPERLNALTENTHDELDRAIADADKDDAVRVIILTGSGRGFCSGDDVRDIFLSPEEEKHKSRAARLSVIQGEYPFPGGGHKLLQINTPSIAAVNGVAVGYGCDMALMCNMRVASEKARFSEIFLKVGLVPDESMILLPKVVGLAKAYEMILTADFVNARDALQIGLVNKVVPHENLMPATLELAARIASKPPIAVKLSMEGIRKGLNLHLKEFMQFHGLAAPFCAETEDHLEGAKAFMEKREPVFKGK